MKQKTKFPYVTDHAEMGDVIMSDAFAKGDKDSRGVIDIRDGKSNSPRRAKASFVVEEAMMTGGGTGMGPGDVYPDGWEITARKLRSNGAYDPNGEVIRFYQSGCFNCMVEKVTVIGRMRRIFV